MAPGRGGAAPTDVLQQTLVAAQRTADEAVAEARALAEQAIDDARLEAEHIVGEMGRGVGPQVGFGGESPPAAVAKPRVVAIRARARRAVHRARIFDRPKGSRKRPQD